MAQIVAAGVPANPEKRAVPSTDVSKDQILYNDGTAVAKVQTTSQEIDWRYLTFGTPLPTPNPIASRPDAPPAATHPDLSKLGNPVLWSTAHKWTAVLVSSFGCLMVAYASASYASALRPIEEEFGITFNVANLGITTYNIGFAIIPMLCAPLSESIGRYPIFTISGILFVVAQVCCGATRSYAGLVIARFLAGCGGSTFSTIVGGVVSDLFVAEGRNTPMAVFSSTTLCGVGFGLAVSGAIVQDISWRWVFYVQAIISAAVVTMVAVFLRETRGSVVLRRRANAINKWYEQLEEQGYIGVETGIEGATAFDGKKRYRVVRWKVEADEKRPKMLNLIWISLVRPFKMLCTEPVVFFFSLWATFTWSVLYLTFESVPLVFSDHHNFNDRENGLVFMSMFVATLFIALPLCLIADKKTRESPKLGSTPEARLFFVCFMSAFLPIGLFWFGWTQFPSIPWIVPVLAIGCLGIGIFFVYLAVFNYFADVYGAYASSAMAGSSFCRNMVSGVFPYFSNTMFQRLTYQGASSLLGGLAILLMMAPVLLLFNGPKIRAMSKFVVK